MLFISRFIKKDQPYVIQIKSDTRRLTGYNLLPPFPFFPRFMNSSDNKASYFLLQHLRTRYKQHTRFLYQRVNCSKYGMLYPAENRLFRHCTPTQQIHEL